MEVFELDECFMRLFAHSVLITNISYNYPIDILTTPVIITAHIFHVQFSSNQYKLVLNTATILTYTLRHQTMFLVLWPFFIWF